MNKNNPLFMNAEDFFVNNTTQIKKKYVIKVGKNFIN